MEENKKYILSTRDLDESLVSKATESDIVIQTISFIQTEPIINDQLKKQIQEVSSLSLNVVFTSMNAAEAVGNYLNGKKPEWKIFCLGTATKKVVQLHFGDGLLAATAVNASALADEIISNGVKSVVFFCGDQRRNELPEKLAGHNIQLHEIVVYKTFLIPRTIDRQYDSILFFSPSAVKSFFLSNAVSANTILFAIGATTADSIRQFSNNTVIESDLPGKENLVEKAISYLCKSNKPNEHIKK